MIAALLPLGEVHAQQIFRDGFEESCLLDSDGDRLVNCEEVSRATSPVLPDTDGDGLDDGDEVLGTTSGLNLPAFGVNPRHKDVLVEMDWTDDAFECAQHTHRPGAQAITEARVFYASLPLTNPDGLPGVNLIVDYGQGGAFTGGGFIEIADGITGFLGQEFHQWKASNLAPDRIGVFRYQLHGHRLAYGNNNSGFGNVGGDNSVVTLRCLNSEDNIRNTIIHELGHNFGLQHGGNTHCNAKPNYNSLMNHKHQFNGIDTNCDMSGDGIDLLGYSDGKRNSLVQGALSEPAGVCPPNHPQHKPIDWNTNGMIDSGLVSTPLALASECAQTTQALDFNDNAGLYLAPFSSQNGAPPPGGEPTDSGPCASPPEP